MTVKKTNSTIGNTIERPGREEIISSYMEYVLQNEKVPGTVYKFSKEIGITEEIFYEYFGSFEGLQKAIWIEFYEKTFQLLEKSNEFSSFGNREKLLTFYFTFFEILTANRSYVLFILDNGNGSFKNVGQLKGLRKKLKEFAGTLVREANEEKSSKLFQQSEIVFSEATWVQFIFLLKFWIDDNSPKFESTDVAIEKSVNTAFDLFNNTPLERVVDLGKFIWKEKIG